MTDNQQYQLGFVGTVLPESACTKEPACSQAGNAYQLGILRGWAKAARAEPTVFAAEPREAWPSGRLGIARAKQAFLPGGTRVDYVPFPNITVLKEVAIAAGLSVKLRAWLRQRRVSPAVILVYNVFFPFSLPVLIAARQRRALCVAVVADTPDNVYSFKGLRGILQRMDFLWQRNVLRRFDGLIPLTSLIARDFAPSAPFAVVEGAVSETSRLGAADSVLPSAGAGRVVIYAGTLSPIGGVDILLRAFAGVRTVDAELWVCGQGPLDALVRDASSRDSRIRVLGRVAQDQIGALFRQAKVLVNPRPASLGVTRYSFPSKILEYLAAGRPVISSRLQGIPEDYFDYLLEWDGESSLGLRDLLERALMMDGDEAREFGDRARQWVLENKTWARQGARVHDFLGELVRDSARCVGKD